MKVAILTSFFPTTVLPGDECVRLNLQRGHTFPWITSLAEGLAVIPDTEVHVITLYSKFLRNYFFKKHRVHYDFLAPANRYTRRLSLFELDRIKVHQYLNEMKFDVVHGQGFEKYGYIATTSGGPNILTVHLYNNKPIGNFLKYDDFSIEGLYNAILRVIHQQVIRRTARNLISISPFISEVFSKIRSIKTIYEIENAVAPSFFQKADNQDHGFILYIGSIDQRKSLLDLVKATHSIPGVTLKIISGTTSGHYFEMVKRYVDLHGLKSRIDFVGHVENYEIVKTITKCTCVVLPSKKEGAPMVISEAMAVGKPVIATNVDGIPYMIKDLETGLIFSPGNVLQLTEKLNLLLADPLLRGKLGQAARAEAAKRWHPDVVAAKTRRAYECIQQTRTTG